MKTDKILDRLTKRLENLLSGSSPVLKWDNGRPSNGLTISNWDIVNAVIKEHPDDSWFVPKENIINCWTCLVNFTIGNIDLRDFELERRFADMRHERVEEYNRKWDEALDRKDTEYLDKHPSSVTAPTFWSNWSKEELDYYENEKRFPNLKQEGYKPNWILQQKYKDEKEG